MNVAKTANTISNMTSRFVKKIDPLAVVTKGAGALALLSVLNESNKIAVNQASQDSKVFEANKAVKLGIGAGKLNYESPKYNEIKKHIYDKYPYGIGKAWNGLKGYFSGFSKGMLYNGLTVGFSVFALMSKHKSAKIISLTGLLGSIGFNFVKHGTNLLEKTDHLEQ